MFCSNCGEELPENANFCLECGVRTKKGAKDRVQTPYAWVNLTDQLDKIGQEIEKALSEAGKDMERVFKTVTDTIREATSRKPVVCSNCGEESAVDARFCYKCGKKLR